MGSPQEVLDLPVKESPAVSAHNTPPALVTETAVVTPMALIDRAMTSGATPETLEKLLALQERWEAGQARKAFDEAMAAAKSEIPTIKKNRHVGFESKKAGAARTDYHHEDMAEIARTVDPILSKNGLSYRFRATSELNQPITVTCIISHRMGHSETTTLSAGRDDTGNKNSIQQIGSTITYLQRYTLKAALGLSAAADDDGRSSGPEIETLTEKQIDDIRDLLETHGKPEAGLKQWLRVERLEDVPADKFESICTAIKAPKQK